MNKIDFVNSTQPALNDTNLNLMQDNIEMAINAQVSGDTLPIGAMLPYSGTSIPANWLLCDGREISRTDYAQLYNVIGTRYGVGDGSTTFSLPNMKGRVPVGYDSSQSEFNSTGKTGGEKTHTLTIDEMPSHTHDIVGTQGTSTPGISFYPAQVVTTASNKTDSNIARPTGGGSAHNNLQPYLVQRYIIKAFQTAGTVAQIVNAKSTSTTDAYSALYINNLHSYSTTEKVVGTWIDGKPIYRKVINTGQLPNASQKTVNHGITSIKRLIRLFGNALDTTSGNIYNLPMVNKDSLVYQIALRANTTQIVIETGIDRTNFDESYAIIEYTKTTD